MKQAGLVLFFVFFSVVVFGQEYKYDRDIAYRGETVDDYTRKMCRLDVAYQEGVKDVPVIVWFHGGGLTGGHRTVPKPLLTDHFIVVGVGYRFSPHVKTDEIVDDAAAAIAWVFDHIGQYGGSESKIYIAGHSAGGYLVDMVGLDRSRLAKYGKEANLLAGIIPFSGQVITHFETRKQMGMTAYQPLIDQSAPLYHVRKDAPPILILSGDREKELYGRYEETAYFRRMLKLSGHPDVTMYELEGYGHGDMCEPAYPLAIRFIKRLEKGDK